MSSPPEPLASHGRGRRCELWLLCADAGNADRPPAEWRARFERTPVERVIGPVGSASVAAIAAALGARAVALPALPGDPHEAAVRAWGALEGELEGSAVRLLAVLDGPLLRALVAHALGMPRARAEALRVDPGALVLLRDDPIGIVLRRSNVAAPEEDAGTELPWAREPAPR